MNKNVLPSERYKKRLLAIKKELMLEIYTYFEYGKFKMSNLTVIDYLTELGTFTARFDTIYSVSGLDLKLRNTNNIANMVVIGFNANEDTNIENDISFLLRLLNYVDMDYRKAHNDKRPNK